MDKYEEQARQAVEELYKQHPSFNPQTLVSWANQYASDYKKKTFKAYNSPLVEKANETKRKREKITGEVSVAEKSFNYQETKDASTGADWDV